MVLPRHDDDEHIGARDHRGIGGNARQAREMDATPTGKMIDPAFHRDAAGVSDRGEAIRELGIINQRDLAAEQGEFRRHRAAAVAGPENHIA